MIKYGKEINEMLESICESWMDYDDKEEFKIELLKATGVTMQNLSDQIQVGVDNGYPVESQLRMIKTLISA